MLWKANMDLQYVGESSLAIAQCVMGYVTKAERSNMQDLSRSLLNPQQAVVIRCPQSALQGVWHVRGQ